MTESITRYIHYLAVGIEGTGVVIIVAGVLYALIKFGFGAGSQKMRSYSLLRQEIGRGMLLGLEILVAGDIIATVATEPKMDQVLTLGVIVLIRTFLSISLELEVEGKLPWKKQRSGKRETAD